jgi:hypothetical protein
MSTLSGRDGHLRPQLQAVHLWLPGSFPYPGDARTLLDKLFSQICQFCWHHIKENLNGRCPACRRVYTDDMVEFKPIPKDEFVNWTNAH